MISHIPRLGAEGNGVGNTGEKIEEVVRQLPVIPVQIKTNAERERVAQISGGVAVNADANIRRRKTQLVVGLVDPAATRDQRAVRGIQLCAGDSTLGSIHVREDDRRIGRQRDSKLVPCDLATLGGRRDGSIAQHSTLL